MILVTGWAEFAVLVKLAGGDFGLAMGAGAKAIFTARKFGVSGGRPAARAARVVTDVAPRLAGSAAISIAVLARRGTIAANVLIAAFAKGAVILVGRAAAVPAGYFFPGIQRGVGAVLVVSLEDTLDDLERIGQAALEESVLQR